MTAKTLGCSVNNLTALDAGLVKAGGRPLDCIRTYAILGNWQNQDPAQYAGAGRRVIPSIKPKDAAGFKSPASIAAGGIDSLLVPMYSHLLGLPRPKVGRHRFIPWHEADTYIAKTAGAVPADVDAAIAHMLDLFTRQPGFDPAVWDVSLTVTGYQWPQRAPLFPKSIALVQKLKGVLAFDQPYTEDPEAYVGPAVDYSVLHFPGLRLALHEMGRSAQVVNGETRAQWFVKWATLLQGKRYDAVEEVLYWNSADDIINASLDPAADILALAAFQAALSKAPVPPPVPSTSVPTAELATLAAAAKRVSDASAALAAAQSVYDTAMSDLTAAIVAVNTP